MMLQTCLRFVTLFSVLLTIGSSCEKFSGQSIPAYLTIDSIYLSTDYMLQGTDSHSITDAWVYIDDELLGAFELPARFPVLKTGNHSVMVWPGIKKDGIAATRINYDYYNPIVKNINFTPDSTAAMGRLKTTYQSSAKFTWKEDFEQVSISLDTINHSGAWIQKTANGSPLTFEGNHSGMVVMDSIHDYFECQMHSESPIPYATPVYLEMNFNTSNSLDIGVFSYGTTILYQTKIITLNPTHGKWKKIYIDLTTTLNSYTGMSTYRVYMGAFKDAGMKQDTILFDNFKVVAR
jgi:hypothetical protein